MPQRVLSESEFNAIRDHVLKTLPDNLSEDDFTRAVGPLMASAIGEAENSPKPVEGSALGRFVSNAWDTLNPLNLAKAVIHPIDTASGLISAQVGEGKKTYQAAKDFIAQPSLGRASEVLGHGTATILPVFGPMAANAGEQIAEGDVAGGVGKGFGLTAPLVASTVIRARNAPNPRAADILTRQAEDQVASRVLAPANPKFKVPASRIAPEVLKRGLAGDRDALRQIADEGMHEAGTRIDAEIQSAGGRQAPVPVQDVVSKLDARIADLRDSTGQPLSDQAAVRIKILQDKITQLRANRKGIATYDDLAGIRDENYRIADEGRVYSKQSGEPLSDKAWAAGETGGAIREAFADRSPAQAAANADYHFFKTLGDILDPTLGRPKNMAPSQGVTGGARTVGAVTGAMVGGKAGAFIGSTVLPWIQEKIASPQWQLIDAQQKMKLAVAMRRGDIGAMKAWMLRIEKGAEATSPNESQSQTPVPVRP